MTQQQQPFDDQQPDEESTLARLYRQLNRVAALREQMRTHPQDQQDRDALRQWQAERLGRTHRDLLESKRYGPAAQFFLTVTEKLAERFVGLQPLSLGAH